MGIELYIQGYSEVGEGGLERDQVLDIFDLGDVTPDDFGFFPLIYDGVTYCHLTVRGEGGVATNICVHRPTGHPDLWQNLFTLLTTGPYVLFAPDGTCPQIGQAHIREWLPPDMVASLGEPVIVADAMTMESTLFPTDL